MPACPVLPATSACSVHRSAPSPCLCRGAYLQALHAIGAVPPIQFDGCLVRILLYPDSPRSYGCIFSSAQCAISGVCTRACPTSSPSRRDATSDREEGLLRKPDTRLDV